MSKETQLRHILDCGIVAVVRSPDSQQLVEVVRALTDGGYLAPEDARDPWGRPYGYRVDGAGFEISAAAGGGDASGTVVRHPFSAAQRMILEGGVAERLGAARP